MELYWAWLKKHLRALDLKDAVAKKAALGKNDVPAASQGSHQITEVTGSGGGVREEVGQDMPAGVGCRWGSCEQGLGVAWSLSDARSERSLFEKTVGFEINSSRGRIGGRARRRPSF